MPHFHVGPDNLAELHDVSRILFGPGRVVVLDDCMIIHYPIHLDSKASHDEARNFCNLLLGPFFDPGIAKVDFTLRCVWPKFLACVESVSWRARHRNKVQQEIVPNLKCDPAYIPSASLCSAFVVSVTMTETRFSWIIWKKWDTVRGSGDCAEISLLPPQLVPLIQLALMYDPCSWGPFSSTRLWS